MSTYDAVPYPSGPIRPAHPDRLAALAAICGLQPAPVERCRVLELGCSDGGNLIPLAELLPDASFVGIDNSPRQIADGRTMVDALQLSNIRLDCLDLLQLPEDFGEFDYIICHGVFSWVPESVQDRILQICGAHLAPHGVAFISYNTYPGWHLRGMIREMMLAHVAEFPDPQTRIDQAQSFLDFLVRFTPDAGQPYALILQGEQARLKQRPRTYLFHEHLEACNTPLYFREFMERAARAGLGYLGDEMLPAAWKGRAHPEAVHLMNELETDILRREQYLDFLQGCMFRQSLLTRAAAPVNFHPQPSSVRGCWLSASLEPRSPVDDLWSRLGVEFGTPDDRSVTLTEPIAKAALLQLSRIWPRSIPYGTLLERALAMLQVGSPSAEATQLDDSLADSLLQCVAAGLVHPSLTPQRFAEAPSNKPRATGFARLKAAAGAQVTTVTHYPLAVPEIHRQILLQLDGEHDLSALVAGLAQQVERGELQMESDGGSVPTPAERDNALAAVVRESLHYLAGAALLVE